jgi:peptidoglycan/xylan/chitin deacetylase (PgdA/CDA1 family)
MDNARPFVSFTFDDVPKSACTRGGRILEGLGIRATYYLAMSLMDGVYSIGAAFSRADLEHLIANGHEIGSHTFDHLDAWTTRPGLFEASIHANQRRLSELHPGRIFRTFSYPISTPHPRNKKKAGELHVCCRGGGQAFNSGAVDRSLLKSCFMDARNRDNFDVIKKMVDESCARTGWLILNTHDIDERPSPYGCAPEFLEAAARYALDSGAEILPVDEVWARLDAGAETGSAGPGEP